MINNNEPSTLPGFRDFLPEVAKKRQWLIRKISQVCEMWGYDPMETPTLERLEIFQGQVGEDEKLFFKFQDPGGRDVALRYDQTVPTCRVVGQYANQLTFPFKRYQIQSAFRAEKPQKGRYREFLQIDADIFGSASPLADAEVIALSLDIYRQLGFPRAIARINDRSLFKDFPYEAVSAIDKIEKIGNDGVIQDMIDKGISAQKAKEYLAFVQNLTPNETIKTIMEYLKNCGFDESWFKFDPTIARSFSYSTGPIWEIVIPEIKGSVLGGERYDKLVQNISGQPIAGTGFGLGFDRTMEAAEQLGLIPNLSTSSKCLVTIFSPELLTNSINVTTLLRNGKINCEIYPDTNAKLDKQLRYANNKKIPFAIIIGPDEAKNDSVTVKDLNAKSQTTVALKDLLKLMGEKN